MSTDPAETGDDPNASSLETSEPTAEKVLGPDLATQLALIVLGAAVSGVTPDQKNIVNAPLRAVLEPRAQNTMVNVGSFDPRFAPALLAFIHEIELDPTLYHAHPDRPELRVAKWIYTGFSWTVQIYIAEHLRLIYILSIELDDDLSTHKKPRPDAADS